MEQLEQYWQCRSKFTHTEWQNGQERQNQNSRARADDTDQCKNSSYELINPARKRSKFVRTKRWITSKMMKLNSYVQTDATSQNQKTYLRAEWDIWSRKKNHKIKIQIYELMIVKIRADESSQRRRNEISSVSTDGSPNRVRTRWWIYKRRGRKLIRMYSSSRTKTEQFQFILRSRIWR